MLIFHAETGNKEKTSTQGTSKSLNQTQEIVELEPMKQNNQEPEIKKRGNDKPGSQPHNFETQTKMNEPGSLKEVKEELLKILVILEEN